MQIQASQKSRIQLQVYLHRQIIWSLLISHLQAGPLSMLNNKTIGFVEVFNNRFQGTTFINRKTTTNKSCQKRKFQTVFSYDQDNKQFKNTLNKLQRDYITHVSSPVVCDVKPDIRYFLRIFPRCVTSTLTPLRAFLIC